VAQTGQFSRTDQTKIEAKIGSVARGEPAMPVKLLETKDRELAERVGFEPNSNARSALLDALETTRYVID
jgi:hypothetical protein